MLYTRTHTDICMYVCLSVCMYVCIYTCIYIYICIYLYLCTITYTYIYTYIRWERERERQRDTVYTSLQKGCKTLGHEHLWCYPDPREDPKFRFLNGGSYKVPLVVQGLKLGDLLSRSSRGSGYLTHNNPSNALQPKPYTLNPPFQVTGALGIETPFWGDFGLRLFGALGFSEFRVAGFRVQGLGLLGCTWTRKVCSALCRCWAIILPTFGGFRQGLGCRGQGLGVSDFRGSGFRALGFCLSGRFLRVVERQC